MTKQEIKELILKDWIAKDGLMRISLDDDKDPAPGYNLRTVGNENGILWACVFYYLCESNNLLVKLEDWRADKNRFSNAVKLLQVNDEDKRGLFNRWPGKNHKIDALDNYVGIVAGSVLFGLTYTGFILEYGRKTGFYFNNTNDKAIRAIALRQGSDVAYYQLCAGEVPSIINFIWLCGGMLWNVFFDKFKSEGSPSKASEWGMSWLRIKAIDKTNHMPTYYKAMYKFTRMLWIWKFNRYGGIHEILKRWIGHDHILVEFSKGIVF